MIHQINGAAGTVILQPSTPGRAINIGGAGGLNITSTELQTISVGGGTLHITANGQPTNLAGMVAQVDIGNYNTVNTSVARCSQPMSTSSTAMIT